MGLCSAQAGLLERRRLCRVRTLRRDAARRIPHLSGRRLVLFSYLSGWWGHLARGARVRGRDGVVVGGVRVFRQWRGVSSERTCDVYADLRAGTDSGPRGCVRSLTQLRGIVARLDESSPLLELPPGVGLPAAIQRDVRARIAALQWFLVDRVDGALRPRARRSHPPRTRRELTAHPSLC